MRKFKSIAPRCIKTLFKVTLEKAKGVASRACGKPHEKFKSIASRAC